MMRKKFGSTKNKSSAVYYLFVNLICVIFGIAVFTGTDYLLHLRSDCANSKTCKSDLTQNIDNESLGVFAGRTVVPPKIDLALDSPRPAVLGTNSGEQKHIYVDLSTQQLYAYEGVKQFMKTYIASGRWGRTPTGNFNIWQKLRATRMAGGQGADAYDLPNVPHVMYFYNDFGLHGAYWHNNFGYPMSHGCVNMRLVDAKKLFEWADGPAGNQKGTAVSVCDQFREPNNCVQDSPIK